jgi:protein SCO1/2
MACAGALVLAGCSASGSAQAGDTGGDAHVSASRFHGFSVAHPLPKPDVTLTDTSGHDYDIAARTRGHLLLLYYGFTHCDDTCPQTMAAIAAALRQAPPKTRQDTDVVFVTTDPHRDTPHRLRHWLDRFSAHFVGLTGSKAALAKAYRAVGMPPPQIIPGDDSAADAAGVGGGRVPSSAPLPAHSSSGYDVEHGADVYAYGPDGKAHLAFGPDAAPADYAHDLTLLDRGETPKPLDVAQLVAAGANGRVGAMRVVSAFVPQPARGQDPIVELTLGNAAGRSDALTAAATSVGGTVHLVDRAGRQVRRLTVPAHGTTVLSASGPHLVIADRDTALPPLRKGHLVKITLTFRHAGTGTLTIPVTGPSGPGS